MRNIYYDYLNKRTKEPYHATVNLSDYVAVHAQALHYHNYNDCCIVFIVENSRK